MGTRSITHIHQMRSLDSDEGIVCSFYRSFDGYPSAHGCDLAGWLSGKGLKNGIDNSFDKRKHFNRAGAMAIKLTNYISELTSCELIPAGENDDFIDFEYHVYFDEEFTIKIVAHGGSGVTVKASEFNHEHVDAVLFPEEE